MFVYFLPRFSLPLIVVVFSLAHHGPFNELSIASRSPFPVVHSLVVSLTIQIVRPRPSPEMFTGSETYGTLPEADIQGVAVGNVGAEGWQG